jgi:signal peptidase I
MRLLAVLGALVVLGVDVPTAGAQGQEDPGKVRAAKFLYDSEAARLDVVVFRYPPKAPATPATNYVKRLAGLPGETIVIRDGALSKTPGLVIERITVEGGKVEISGDTIKIEGGMVEITRQPVSERRGPYKALDQSRWTPSFTDRYITR